MTNDSSTKPESYSYLLTLQEQLYSGAWNMEALIKSIKGKIGHTYTGPKALLELLYILKVLREEHDPKVVDLLIDTIKSNMDFWCEDAGIIIVVDMIDIILSFKRSQDIDFIASMMYWDLYQIPSQILLLTRRYGWVELWNRIMSETDLSSEYDEYIRKQYDKLKNSIEMESLSDINSPLLNLRSLLDHRCEGELQYQKLLGKYPWILGVQYKKVESHSYLDDENIPDFTGVRVHDDCHDIIEIKQPFLRLFRNDGNFCSSFNDSWNQIERYLDFSREETDYLRRKGLIFNNPNCYLIIGYELTTAELSKIRTKERMNLAIHILTYNDLLRFVENTIALIRKLQ